ncbi:hypothetical protein KNV19_gp61 [Gordonia phage Portcullis]|uniref:Uncharacterized protein n=1 Tax=Gordonia phage Portcullis TaxID=2762414 RepID=A0A7G8LGK3_9CAUD|nr:hypothetical protein KNV19_gp61 [Gordonia phage Portcullis]QNJ56375.1 hypothetical protein SEA_PORTCULLIS_61 [Gordonia phage Portcullis]
MTERDLLDALHEKLDGEAQGNGGHRWIIAEKVRCRAGFAGWDPQHGRLRTADALAIDTWMSKGMELHGFEVKCSRSDWLTELKQPEKSEAFRRICDRWWLVTSDPSIVKPGELPDGWGHMSMVTRSETRYVGGAVWLPDWEDDPAYESMGRRYARVPVTTLRRVSTAPKMPDRDPIPRHLLATLMRATAVTAARRLERTGAAS